MAVFYLVPSADISVEHSLSSGTSGYLLIDDIVSDNGSTYLYSAESANADTTVSATSSFLMSATNIPNDAEKIISAKIICSTYANSNCSNESIKFTINVNGTSLDTITLSSSEITNAGLVDLTGTYSSNVVDISDSRLIEAFVNYINGNTANIPDVSISFTTSYTGGKSGSGYLRISQVIIEFEYDLGIHRKVNDTWKKAVSAYKKVNGIWTSFTDSRSVLSTGEASLGHHHIPINAVAATCTETGLTKGYECSICGKIIVPQNVTEAKGHISKVVAAVEPTCGTVGLTEGSICSVCYEILIEQDTIPATGNHADNYKTVGNHVVCSVCGYIDGIGQVELAYHGTATELSVARSDLAATTIGNYALFGGGDTISGYKSTVDAYNSSLTRSTPTELSVARYRLTSTAIGSYALFGGGSQGESNDSQLATVDAYNTSLTRSAPTELSAGRYLLASTTIGDYALFGGGQNISNGSPTHHARVDAYNSSLTRSIPTELSVARSELAATTIGNYALFGGGKGYDTSVTYVAIDVYDASLTKTTLTASVNIVSPSAATVGNYALFTSNGGTVVAYDTSLTHFTPDKLSNTSTNPASTVIGGYALFGSNRNTSSAANAIVDSYNTFLTHSTQTELSVARSDLASATVGNYALFGGGVSGTTRYSTVDAYKIQPIS